MGGKHSKEVKPKSAIGHLKGTSYHNSSKSSWLDYWKTNSNIKIGDNDFCPCIGPDKERHMFKDKKIVGAHAYYIDNSGKVNMTTITICFSAQK